MVSICVRVSAGAVRPRLHAALPLGLSVVHRRVSAISLAVAACSPWLCRRSRVCADVVGRPFPVTRQVVRLCVDLCLLRRAPPWSTAPWTGCSRSAAAVESTCDSWMSRLESLWACAVRLCE